MSRVTVHFYGICTHVKMKGTHRVILPKAGPEQIAAQEALRQQRLHPHIARLQILKDDLPDPPDGSEDIGPAWSLRLDGDTLSINNPAASQHSAKPGQGGTFPSLNAYCCAPVELRPDCYGPLATSALADCFFDFPDVTPLARRAPRGEESDGATVASVIVETRDAPVISMKRPDGREILLTVQDGAEITVFSYPASRPSADKDADFLLHFLLAPAVPLRSWFPPAPPWEECGEDVLTDNPPLDDSGATISFTGPGCSNSNYP